MYKTGDKVTILNINGNRAGVIVDWNSAYKLWNVSICSGVGRGEIQAFHSNTLKKR
jgi:hypothetical protein